MNVICTAPCKTLLKFPWRLATLLELITQELVQTEQRHKRIVSHIIRQWLASAGIVVKHGKSAEKLSKDG